MLTETVSLRLLRNCTAQRQGKGLACKPPERNFLSCVEAASGISVSRYPKAAAMDTKAVADGLNKSHGPWGPGQGKALGYPGGGQRIELRKQF